MFGNNNGYDDEIGYISQPHDVSSDKQYYDDYIRIDNHYWMIACNDYMIVHLAQISDHGNNSEEDEENMKEHCPSSDKELEENSDDGEYTPWRNDDNMLDEARCVNLCGWLEGVEYEDFSHMLEWNGSIFIMCDENYSIFLDDQFEKDELSSSSYRAWNLAGTDQVTSNGGTMIVKHSASSNIEIIVITYNKPCNSKNVIKRPLAASRNIKMETMILSLFVTKTGQRIETELQ